MINKISDVPTVENLLENSEAFNKVVLESSPDCLKILDTQGRIQYMNFNGLCQMEIDDFSMFKNQLWWELWGVENENLVKDAIDIAVRGEATEFSAFCATAKGTPKWWHVTLTPVGTAKNGIYQLLSVSRDITAQKNAEAEMLKINNLLEEKVKIRTEELVEKNKELEKINEELSTFNHIASHDLQEPLRKIQIFSKLILAAENNIDASHLHFKRIIDATDRMRNLIDALLKFSISKSEKVIFEPCDLNEILLDVIEYSQDTINDKQAIVEVDVLPSVKGSRVLITQLLINILENALKYSKKDVLPRVRFSCHIVNANDLEIPIKKNSKEFYALRIEDNGIGFDNEYRHQIFEIFKRLHGKDQFMGTGIGLAICKTIVEKHYGFIDTISTPNVGSTFIIYLPKD